MTAPNTKAEEQTNKPGDPNSATALMMRALTCLYITVDESVASNVEQKVMAVYIEKQADIQRLQAVVDEIDRALMTEYRTSADFVIGLVRSAIAKFRRGEK